MTKVKITNTDYQTEVDVANAKKDLAKSTKSKVENKQATIQASTPAYAPTRIINKKEVTEEYYQNCEKSKSFIQALASGKMLTNTQTEGNDSEGGHLVPVEFYRVLVEIDRENRGLTSKVSRRTMAGDTMEIPTKSNPTTTIGTTNEGAKATERNVTFGMLKMVAQKWFGYTKITKELRADSAVNVGIVDIVARSLIEDIRDAQENMLVNSAGTGDGSAPMGLWSGIKTGSSFAHYKHIALSSGSINLTSADLYNMIYAVHDRAIESDGCGWLVSKKLLAFLQTIKTDQGRYAFRDSTSENSSPNRPGTRGSLLGFPVSTSGFVPYENNPAVASGLAANKGTAIFFGDYSSIVMGERQGISVESTNTNEDDFVKGLITVIADARGSSVIEKPTYLAGVTVATKA